MNKSFSLYSRPYLDTINKCYSTLITINCLPYGPLRKFVRKINFPKLSPFKQHAPCNPIQNCEFVIISINKSCSKLMTLDQLPDLFSFLQQNRYNIDTKLTKMIQTSDIQISDEKNLIAFVNILHTYSK